MGLMQFELTGEDLWLHDTEENSGVILTIAQLRTLVKYVETHPLDGHGWANHIREDGTLTGHHPCPCHNLKCPGPCCAE